MKIEQNGTESAMISANGSFVMVRVPVQLVGEVPRGGATVRYSVGSFIGLETKLLTRTGTQVNLTFRIPKELFRSRQRLHLEVMAPSDEGGQRVLWAKRYEADWIGKEPRVVPVVDLLGEEPGTKH